MFPAYRLRMVLLMAAGMAAVFGFAALGAQAQSPRAPVSLAPIAPEAVYTTAISYQGRLTQNGAPVNMTCDFDFRLFDDAGAGLQIGGDVTATLAVSGGLYTAPLNFGATAFNGQARWLDTQVRCPANSGGYTALTPRQPLLPAPYALTLAPGALISGTVQYPLTVFASTAAIGNPAAVHGIAGGLAALSVILPIGVHGESHSGFGLAGASDTSIGVYAYSNSNSASAAWAENDALGGAIRANSFNGPALQASSTMSYGVRALTAAGGATAAIYGENTGGGYGVTGKSGNVAVYAQNTNVNGIAAYLGTQCCAADLYGDVAVHGNLSVSGSKGGYVVDIALNAGNGALAAGDVVAVVGAATPVVGTIPTARVVKAGTAYQTGVMGVVDQHVVHGAYLKYDDGPITPGEYLSVVTLGLFRTVNVDASYGAIHAGDLLVASPHAGYAMKATDRAQAVGAIVGKALGDLSSGAGAIPVLATLQ